MEKTETKEMEFKADPTDMDEDQFVSIWNVAASTVGGDQAETRLLASKMLGYLCKYRCAFVVASPTDAKYLDDWFERDNSLLYNWKPESETVDVLAQHALVPFDLLTGFLRYKKFSVDKNYAPRRADRVAWFSEEWNVG